MKKVKKLPIKEIINFYKKFIIERFWFLVLLVLISSFLEFLGISIFLPLIGVSQDNKFIDETMNLLFKIVGLEKNVISLSIFLMILFSFKFALLLFQNHKFMYISNILIYRIRKEIVERIVRTDYLHFLIYSSGEINNLITKETEKAYQGLAYFLELLSLLGVVIIYVYLAFNVSLKVTLIAMSFGTLFIFAFKRINKLTQYYSKKILRLNERSNQYITEFIYSLKYIIATNSSKRIIARINSANYDFSMGNYKTAFYGAITKYSIEPIGIIIVSCLILINHLFFKESTIDTVVTLGLLYRIFTKVSGVQYTIQKIYQVSASLEKLISFIKNISENISCKNGNIKVYSIDNITLKLKNFRINEKIILKNVNINLTKGKVIGIVGESGSGKTTLLNILSSLYNVEKNSLFVNGKDINELNWNSYRTKIGYVSQDSYLFEGSLLENINLSSEKISNKRIIESFKKFNLNDFLNDGNKLKEFNVLSYGNNLSGGQKQRISIVREYLKNIDLLLLDEWSSALDANTEKEIIKNIYKIKNELITVIVSHRLSTVKNADHVYYLEKGEIIAQGTFNKLYKNKKFKELCNNQNIFL